MENKWKELEKAMILSYSKEPVNFFMEKYSCSRSRCYRIAKKFNLTRERRYRLDAKKEDLIQDYKNGLTLKELSIKYNHRTDYISWKFEEWGFPLRTHSEAISKYSYKDFFKTIDTHEKAYWLGFIYADGWVTKWKNQLSFGINLSKKDTQHLQKFQQAFDPERPLYTKTVLITFQVTNQKVVQDLMNLGVYPRKSYYLLFPNLTQVPQEFISSFILGFFDGDGCIMFNEKKNFWTFCLVGTVDMLTSVSKELENFGIEKFRLFQDKRSPFQYNISKGGVITFKDTCKNLRKRNLEQLYLYLYEHDTGFSLTRKKEKFEKILEKRYGKNWRERFNSGV